MFAKCLVVVVVLFKVERSPTSRQARDKGRDEHQQQLTTMTVPLCPEPFFRCKRNTSDSLTFFWPPLLIQSFERGFMEEITLVKLILNEPYFQAANKF
jgi:hypothetical protein